MRELDILKNEQADAQLELSKTREWQRLVNANRAIAHFKQNCNHRHDDGTTAWKKYNAVGYDVIYQCELCDAMLRQ